ncbi:MAG: hypothetical protein KJ666_06225 [Bacteroidetes bacterium]|nr:hypothetical protein [Bacteroidota bacterium]
MTKIQNSKQTAIGGTQLHIVFAFCLSYWSFDNWSLFDACDLGFSFLVLALLVYVNGS